MTTLSTSHRIEPRNSAFDIVPSEHLDAYMENTSKSKNIWSSQCLRDRSFVFDNYCNCYVRTAHAK